MRNRAIRWGGQGTVLLYVALLVIVPIVAVYVNGLRGGWQAFVDNVAQPLAWSAVWLTIKMGVYATLFNAVAGTLIAWTLVRYRFPGRRLLHSLVDLPFALPTAVGGLMILMLVGPNSLLGAWAKQLGWEIVFQTPAIVIAMIFVTFPFVIRTLQPLLEELDPAEEEAAMTLGASRATTFWRVLFPAIMPGVLSGSLLVFSRAIAEFGAVVLVSGNLPGKTLVAAVYIYSQIESDNPLGAAAVSMLLLTLSLGLLWTVNFLQRKRVAS